MCTSMHSPIRHTFFRTPMIDHPPWAHNCLLVYRNPNMTRKTKQTLYSYKLPMDVSDTLVYSETYVAGPTWS